MKIANKGLVLAFICFLVACISCPSFAKDKMHKKGGYVHAHTMTTKSGMVVHVKGHYRHASGVKMKMMSKMTKPKM